MPKRTDNTPVTDGFNFDGANTTTTEQDVTKILPFDDNKVDLGSPSKKFKNIYYSSLTPDPGTGYLPLIGGTMSGGIDLGAHELKNVSTLSGPFTTRDVDDIVSGGNSSTMGNVAVYFDSSGKVLANSLVAVDNIVTNTGGSVTSGNLPIFSGMGGRQIADSFIPSADLVKNSTGSTVVDQVATYSDTTGKNITNSTAPKLGTPASGVLTNCTGLPIATGVSGLGTNVATMLGTFSSSNIRTACTDETGTGGNLVFSTQPNFTGATQRGWPLKLSTLTQYEAFTSSNTSAFTTFVNANSVGDVVFAPNTTNQGMVIKLRAFAQLNSWSGGGTLTISFALNGAQSANLVVPAGTTAGSYLMIEFDCTIRGTNLCRTQGILFAAGQLPVLTDVGGTWTKTNSNSVGVGFQWSVASAGNIISPLGVTIETHYQT